MCFKSHIWRKKKPGLVRVRPGHPGSGSTRRVAPVWPGCCHSRSFIKPELVQPLGRPGPGSTRRAGFNNCGLLELICIIFLDCFFLIDFFISFFNIGCWKLSFVIFIYWVIPMSCSRVAGWSYLFFWLFFNWIFF